MELIEYHNKSNQDITQLNSLVQYCRKYDGMSPKIYWNILRSNLNRAGDFCLFNHDELIAYLGYFLFSHHEAEISAIVHPKYRKQGIFSRIFDVVRKRLSGYSIYQYAFACPKNNHAAKKCLQGLGAKYCSLEYNMSCQLYLKPKVNNNLTLHQATKENIVLLSKIDEACFHTNYKSTQKRFKQMFIESNRLTWLVKNGGQYIGKIHARIDESSVYLHDLCIMPNKRNQGFGSAMVEKTISKLYQLGHRTLTLDVEAVNKYAILIYRNCGFKIINSYEYWKI